MITVKDGEVLDYVGMTFDFREQGIVRVTMKHCIDDILDSCGVEGTAVTPATDNLFNVREDTPKASAEEAIWFHSFTAKMLYVSKRVKPECLTTVAFLSTRVQKCDQDDLGKLRRLLKYLRGSRDRGIAIKIGDEIQINVYIDASYGVHMDSGRSHSGLVVMMGDGPVIVCSSKQKLAVKSSTEAELVALSDYASAGIHLKNFLEGQGYDVGCVIGQDNMSTMALIKRGEPGAMGSRHINIRYFWLKDRIEAGKVSIVHVPTSEMIANILTKPVQGAQFLHERDLITNW